MGDSPPIPRTLVALLPQNSLSSSFPGKLKKSLAAHPTQPRPISPTFGPSSSPIATSFLLSLAPPGSLTWQQQDSGSLDPVDIPGLTAEPEARAEPPMEAQGAVGPGPR